MKTDIDTNIKGSQMTIKKMLRMKAGRSNLNRHNKALTMYIGDPHKVAAIISPGRNLANPKSAAIQQKVQ